MRLDELFKNAPAIEIDQLSDDSRMPMSNAIFFCIKGIKDDGHDFVAEAIENGAKVIVYSDEINRNGKAIYIKVNNVFETLKAIADRFYDYPNNDIDEYVVSGCYGKCSVSSFINHYLNIDHTCAYIGALGIKYSHFELQTSFATLTSLENLKTLVKIKKEGCHSATFEASASSLAYKKLDPLDPDIFIYTNTYQLSPDYRASQNDYYDYIRRYLYHLEAKTKVIFNKDDMAYENLKDALDGCITYGTSPDSDYMISDIGMSKEGSVFTISHDENQYRVQTNLLSLSNVYNLTAAIAALHQQGYDMENIIGSFRNVNYIDGILEKIDEDYNIIIDSAFSLDAMEEIMSYGRFISKNNKLIGVVPICYSDNNRRIEKLISLCEKYLDIVILTEDESYDGDVLSILNRARSYFVKNNEVLIEVRSLAIKYAIDLMNSDDTLLILGKGNEKFLEMGLGKEFYLGDKHYALKYIRKRKEEENETV